MEFQHINIKIPVEGDLKIAPEHFIEVFHRWTAEQSRPELLVDVADYRHVPAGPGVLLVGHEADYGMDNTGGGWGLLYNRKTVLEGSNEDRLRQAFGAAANACLLLETEFQTEGLRFSRKQFNFIINDRATVPNSADVFQKIKPEIEKICDAVCGETEFTIKHEDDPRQRFGVSVIAATEFDLAKIANDSE